MGGGGGILSPITDLLFGRPEQPKMPEIPAPAAPAPSRKQGTGAVVKTGADAANDIRNQRVSGRAGGSSSRGVRSLGTLGRSSLGL